MGAWGENLVAGWYEQEGYRVIARNWRVREGEIDIVALCDTTLVICEVKTRSRVDFGTPAWAVNHDKQRRLRRLAARFVSENPVRGINIRFDVAEVVGTPDAHSVNVIRAAF